MAEQIYIGNFAKGQVTNRLPFVINNDAFPDLFNAYVWRGRAKRKRGTQFLGQLRRQVKWVAASANPWETTGPALVAGAGNLLTGYESTSSVAPGSISIVVGLNTYTEPATPDGTLVGAPGGTGTINYSTGAITISGGGGSQVTGTYSYYPGLPVMGLRDFVLSVSTSAYPLLLSFDTVYSYQINQAVSPPQFYSTSFYKNSGNPAVWSGQDYQLFWTTNYEGALWATNNVPGRPFQAISALSVGAVTTITTASDHGMVTGDYVFFNELTGADASLLNLLAFSITKTGATTFTVAVNTTGKVITSGVGIFQKLTTGVSSQDGIRWYDGDPTATTGIPSSGQKGWVNFCPPLTNATVSINTTTSALYYLVGALAVVPFKDRLLFFSPWIQTSSGSAIQLIDTVIWSWNGTPYYNALVPTNKTFDSSAYFVDQTGKGGWLAAGTDQPIISVSDNEDVLLVGFGGRGTKTRFVYTGNDLQPFLFYSINSELPSTSTFSAISLDKGVIDVGTYGICMTDQQSSQRVDLDIPDSVFQIQNLNSGILRVNAIRDFFREWIYFSYPVNISKWKFPTQSFLFNYRDNTWGILYENFTAHGTYRIQNKKTWATTGFKSWNTWNEAWNSGNTSPLIPSIVGGNPQGYVIIKDKGTGEGISGTIAALASSSGLCQITCYNHCVKANDYLYFSGSIGNTSLNGLIGKVISTADANTFVVDVAFSAGTYTGLGKFTRLSQPFIQTKQFNPYWEQGKQARLSVQRYLLDMTNSGQVTVNINLSQDPTSAWNNPINNQPPNSLIYSQIMYTCPESSNIGLTPANYNLQTPIAEDSFQIWHRYGTSLIGDTFQIAITLSDAQMRNLTYATSEIALHGMHLTCEKGPQLA